LVGRTNDWLASTSDATINSPPPRPRMPKPGRTKISAATQKKPARKSITSSQPLVPWRCWLQK